MLRKLKIVAAVIAAAGMTAGIMADPVRYFAKDAALGAAIDPDQYNQNPQEGSVVEHADAAEGSYVVMRNARSLTFSGVDAAPGEFNDIWIRYSNTYGDKKQHLVINGTQVGEMDFPETGTVAPTFDLIRLAAKIRLNPTGNTVAITHSWGWVDIDYIEVRPSEDGIPWNIATELVTPNASVNARKLYQFLRENFGERTISGVMGNAGDNIIQSQTVNSITEVAHIMSVSGGKIPALVGFDIMQGTGKAVDGGNTWGVSQVNASIRLAKEFYGRGGIPAFMWHWRDPSRVTDEFYTRGNAGDTEFDVSKAFPGGVADVNSDEYKAIVADIDTLAVKYLSQLHDDDIPILWRPLHEAAGAWFWWGNNGAEPLKALWRFMFDRLTNHHELTNLIWVWTCEEGAHALDWYPGDEYVDIIGRDIYAGANNYVSQISSFENLRNIYGGRKIIALSENGPVPDPDNMVADGANWSWFMPWNDTEPNFVSVHNSNAHWNHVMNHNFVLTLADMPNWESYQLTSIHHTVRNRGTSARAPFATVRGRTLSVRGVEAGDVTVRIVDMRGRSVARFVANGNTRFSLANVPAGRYVVETNIGGRRLGANAIIVR